MARFLNRPHIRRHLWDAGAAAALALVALYGGWLYRNFAQDDAFITYRYARNIATGNGFVYNLHQPLLGTTTPLYTLLLALLGKLSGQDIRIVSHVVGMASLWVAAVTLFYLNRDQGVLPAAAVALLFISNPLLMSAIGMETFFLLALMLLALAVYLSGRLKPAAVLLGLLVLTRYETVLFVAIIGGHYWLRQRRWPFWLAPAALIVAGWLVYAWFTFGHIIPRSAVAKLVEDEGFSFAAGALLWWRVYVLQNGGYYALILLLPAGLWAVVSQYRSLSTAERLILVWSGVYFASAGAIAGTFSWYYGPLAPGLAVLLVRGCRRLAGLWRRDLRVQPEMLGLAVFTAGLVLLQLSSWRTGWVTYQGQVIDPRTVHYRQVAQWLAPYAGPETSLATSEIGVLGYYTNNVQIVDLYGLVTPGLIPWLTANRQAMLAKAIELYSPDYLLINEPELNEFLQRANGYRPVAQFDSGTYTLYQKQ